MLHEQIHQEENLQKNPLGQVQVHAYQEENLQKNPLGQVQVHAFSLEDSRLTKKKTEVGSKIRENTQIGLSLTFLAGLVFLWFYSLIKYEFAEDSDKNERRFYFLLFLVSTILISIITGCWRVV